MQTGGGGTGEIICFLLSGINRLRLLWPRPATGSGNVERKKHVSWRRFCVLWGVVLTDSEKVEPPLHSKLCSATWLALFSAL